MSDRGETEGGLERGQFIVLLGGVPINSLALHKRVVTALTQVGLVGLSKSNKQS